MYARNAHKGTGTDLGLHDTVRGGLKRGGSPLVTEAVTGGWASGLGRQLLVGATRLKADRSGVVGLTVTPERGALGGPQPPLRAMRGPRTPALESWGHARDRGRERRGHMQDQQRLCRGIVDGDGELHTGAGHAVATVTC